jgi:hypothetical protein
MAKWAKRFPRGAPIRGVGANQYALSRVLNQMRRGLVNAIAVLLCLLVVGMLVGREKCRLGNVRW